MKDSTMEQNGEGAVKHYIDVFFYHRSDSRQRKVAVQTQQSSGKEQREEELKGWGYLNMYRQNSVVIDLLLDLECM